MISEETIKEVEKINNQVRLEEAFEELQIAWDDFLKACSDAFGSPIIPNQDEKDL